MRKSLTLIFLLFTILTLFATTAEAARFGGGRSFGAQRSYSNFTRSAQPAYQQARPRSSWAAPLAGLAMGGLLGYLFMGHGVGSGMLSWLLIFGLGMMIWSFMRGRLQTAAQTARPYSTANGRVFEGQSYYTGPQATTGGSAMIYPAGFDATTFLREAKIQFIRLQAAYDVKDTNDLREFTAPEVFAEIQMQLEERGDDLNHTEVVSLNADLQDVTTDGQGTLATVKFSGVIRENRNAASKFFDEAWHFRKASQGKWIVAGVQQTQQ